MELVNKFIKNHILNKEEFIELLKYYDDEDVFKQLSTEALKLKQKYYGDNIFIRGLIEISNYCKNNCFYCGIQNSNSNIKRYHLSKDIILDCCKKGYQLGFRTFVLQGGEDLSYSDEDICDIVSSIKKLFPDCAVTLSIGEKSYESYKVYKEAGADRYLLRHETANNEHYQKLHPASMSLENRKQCLYHLKELGYQVGAGFMVGSPFQTLENIAEDLVFLSKLQPQMVGIGPFIPHHDTIFKDKPAGSIQMTLFLLSIIRILLPDVLLPATTALGTLDENGREKAMMCGANVIMPNLSPNDSRKLYELYNNKLCTGDEASEELDSLKKRMKKIHCHIVVDKGDHV